MTQSRTVLITGGSSGIGAALARRYGANGWRVLITGRDLTRLASVVDSVRHAGGWADGVKLDVTNRSEMKRYIEQNDAQAPIDLVIANAGISAGSGARGESAEQARRIFATNLDGVLNTLQPIIPVMQKRGRGQIALVSSLAAFRGFPGAPAYSASKAAVKAYGEALRGALRSDGIRVNVICPGFVESAITDANDFPMPMFMKADKAAAIIARGLEKNTGRIAFPFPMYFASWFMGSMPAGLSDFVVSRLPAKGAEKDG